MEPGRKTWPIHQKHLPTLKIQNDRDEISKMLMPEVREIPDTHRSRKYENEVHLAKSNEDGWEPTFSSESSKYINVPTNADEANIGSLDLVRQHGYQQSSKVKAVIKESLGKSKRKYVFASSKPPHLPQEDRIRKAKTESPLKRKTSAGSPHGDAHATVNKRIKTPEYHCNKPFTPRQEDKLCQRVSSLEVYKSQDSPKSYDEPADCNESGKKGWLSWISLSHLFAHEGSTTPERQRKQLEKQNSRTSTAYSKNKSLGVRCSPNKQCNAAVTPGEIYLTTTGDDSSPRTTNRCANLLSRNPRPSPPVQFCSVRKTTSPSFLSTITIEDESSLLDSLPDNIRKLTRDICSPKQTPGEKQE